MTSVMGEFRRQTSFVLTNQATTIEHNFAATRLKWKSITFVLFFLETNFEISRVKMIKRGLSRGSDSDDWLDTWSGGRTTRIGLRMDFLNDDLSKPED